jgi:hypothetical protein
LFTFALDKFFGITMLQTQGADKVTNNPEPKQGDLLFLLFGHQFLLFSNVWVSIFTRDPITPLFSGEQKHTSVGWYLVGF